MCISAIIRRKTAEINAKNRCRTYVLKTVSRRGYTPLPAPEASTMHLITPDLIQFSTPARKQVCYS